jgi:hypothetical protein
MTDNRKKSLEEEEERKIGFFSFLVKSFFAVKDFTFFFAQKKSFLEENIKFFGRGGFLNGGFLVVAKSIHYGTQLMPSVVFLPKNW